ncbi:Gfo/Idh/MocA family protein [Pseudomonas sp. KT_2_4]|uniref:Gfo/Idh/MocA family protein n=1 Tax=Pseudomonas sp. KT_2_4 TaxID=3241600 RepID=UPI00352BA175
MDMLRFAIIGCGRMGLTRAKALKTLGARIVSSVDSDLARARQIVDIAPGCAALENDQEIDWTQIDGVFICTPPGMRGPLELEAARHGVAVFAEKPLHVSAAGALQLGQAFARSDALFAVGYMNRYRHSVSSVKQHLDTLNVIGYQCHWICKPYSVDWWKEAQWSGGALNEQMTHSVDLCRHLFGDAQSVFAQTHVDPGAPHIQSVSALLQHRDSLAGSIFYSCAGQDKDIGLHIFTDQGPVVLSGWDYTLTCAPWLEGDSQPQDPQDVFLTETECFLQAVLKGDPHQLKCTLKDGIKTQLTVDAIRQAATDQCLIRL